MAFIAVGLGAFGTHSLRSSVTPDRLATWQSGIQYQLVHALAIMLVFSLSATIGQKAATRAMSLFATGILIFSGSLYALVLLNLPILGAITPLGGLCFLVGWGSIVVQAFRTKPS